MKLPIHHLILAGLVLAAITPFYRAVAEEAATPAKPMSVEKSILVSITATVEAIDHKTREVTLKGPLGNTVTFTVDKRVKRLKEVKVGDTVEADYYVSVAAELRKPTPEEEKNPLVVLEAAGRAPKGTSPAGGGLRQFKVVTTVEGLDRTTETITVKGPGGNSLTARVEDPSRLTQIHIGDTIVVTYTEALAVSLEKAEPQEDK
ncbi:MAG: hypothetical protein MUE94_10575 [Verrucomicrobia bacterium]|jgi:Cu/Ag efflux protein CusF|nr:hypothetical protein [Verrucomicrobiota bacterium]